MPGTRPVRTLVVCLALAATAAAGCGNQSTTPTPTLATETLTGSLTVLGSSSKQFTVTYTLAASDASITVNSLTTAAGTVITPTIGVGFGSPAFDGSCTRSSTYTATAATIGQELVASGVFGAGNYCVQIFDSGTLTEPVNYVMTLKHY